MNKVGLNWSAALTLIVALFVSASAFAQEPVGDDVSTTVETPSAAELEDLAESYPEDSTVAFALGLAYARDGQIGPATLFLERAHMLAPLDREVGDALHVVRREARRRRAEAMPSQTIMEGEPSALFWWRFFHVVSERVYARVFLVALWGMFGLFAVWRKMQRSGRRDTVLVVAILVGFVAANAAAFWGGAVWTMANHEPAVIVASEPRYVDAPDELSRPRRQPNLYEGAVAVIIESRDGWRLVELVDGERVWVSADVAVPVLP